MQRVSRAQVRVDGAPVGEIERGMVVLLGVMSGDRADEARRLAERCATFRFFADEEGRMNRSILDVGGRALVVSQVTLAADGRKGRRPSLDDAAAPERARELYETFVAALEALGVACRTGRFGALMEVELVNDGPVTFLLEEPPPSGSEQRQKRPGGGPPSSQALA